MAGTTNKCKKLLLEYAFRRAWNAGAAPTNLYVALVTSATAPTADTNTLSQLTEIAAGNGYTTGGYQLTPNTTDFDTITEDDTLDKGKIYVKDVSWVASGGAIPPSGSGARYAVLTDDNATVANREVLAYWDLSSDRTTPNGEGLRLVDLELDLTES
jgi:hypothetical protein